ncbi:MAG: hypothetical protein MZV63_23910 [Marinilabiliales bacterium]|nr:hypothetical protein [Marinilabiliales bacterium]
MASASARCSPSFSASQVRACGDIRGRHVRRDGRKRARPSGSASTVSNGWSSGRTPRNASSAAAGVLQRELGPAGHRRRTGAVRPAGAGVRRPTARPARSGRG